MKKIFIVPIICLFFTVFAFGEYIYLKTGEEVVGKIISETTTSITVRTAGKNRKILIDDIEEISRKKKEITVIKKVEKQEVDVARTHFTSKAKQELPDSEMIVTDNKSGVIVYNVKETMIGKEVEEKKVKEKKVSEQSVSKEIKQDNEEFDAAAYLLSKSKTEEKKVQPATQDEDEFDAAAYLLSKSNDTAKSKKSADTVEKKPVQKSSTPIAYDDEYDSSKYLLDSDTSYSKEEKKEVKSVGSKKTKTKSSKIRFFNTEEKPESETFLAFSFDLKGVNIFNGKYRKSGIDIGGDFTENSDFGISVSGERYAYLNPLLALGIGGGFEFSRSLEETPGKFSFVPVYAACKMRIINEEMYHVYAVAHLGYNFFITNSTYVQSWDLDKNGGLYLGGGLGASYNKYVFQVLYTVNHASIKYNNSLSLDKVDRDIKFSKVGFFIGYLF